MTILYIQFDGKLIGKGRPRHSFHGHVYTPAKTRAAEKSLGYVALAAMNKSSLKIFEGPVRLSVQLFIEYPKSWARKRRQQTVFYTGKPDADNQIKLICDALNYIVWHDDSQVCEINFRRVYWETSKFHIQVESL